MFAIIIISGYAIIFVCIGLKSNRMILELIEYCKLILAIYLNKKKILMIIYQMAIQIINQWLRTSALL